MSQQDQAPGREVAQRAFAREFNDATHTFQESDDDRAPVYALLPTGAKANRVFVVGTLTDTEDVGTDDEYWQGRVVDPTGTVFAYAGQYQPEVAGMLRDTDPPAFVAVVGKPRTYETDDGSVNVSLRPEHLTIVDEATRNRWVTETARRTLDRIERFDDATNEYAQMARDQYGDAVEPYRQAVIEAVESLDEATAETATATGSATSGDATAPSADDPTPSTDAASNATSADESKQSDTEPPRGDDEEDALGDFDAGDLDGDRE